MTEIPEDNAINPLSPSTLKHMDEWQRLAEIWGQPRVERALIAINQATDPDGKRLMLEETGELLEKVLPVISDKVTVDMPILVSPRSTEVKKLAADFHETYERIAAGEGWGTQEDCRVAFDDLPVANQETMLKVCAEVYGRWLVDAHNSQR